MKEALELARQIRYRSAICLLYSLLGVSAMEQEEYTRARELLEQCVALAREIEHREFLIGGLGNLAQLAIKQGDYLRAEVPVVEGLSLARTMDDPGLIAAMVDLWGQLCFLQKRLDEAENAFLEMLQIGLESNQGYEALSFYGQAQVAQARSNHVAARQLGETSLKLLKTMEHVKASEVEQWLATI